MPDYAKVEYSRSRIEKAGKMISENAPYDDSVAEYLAVVDNWRAAHAYPLDRISSEIKQALSDRNGLLIVQRLKRLDSIVGKLQRPNNTGLYRMQDLGGCRIIVPAVDDVYDIVDVIKRSLENKGHIVFREYDYIDTPAPHSGYRSYHIVVKYQGDDDYNGMLIEVQIRTKLQHSWATAVEIIDCIENDTLKAGTGKEVYRFFFKLVSALFSLKERTHVIAGLPQAKKEIVEEIYRIENEEHIREKFSAYSSAIRMAGDYPNDADYFILVTDMLRKTIEVIAFERDDISDATRMYQELEKKTGKKNVDVVLIAAQSFSVLRESYPNYFLEAQLFLSNIAELCSEYPEHASINLDVKKRSSRVTELFSIVQYTANVPIGEHLQEDGIGIPDGNLVYCPSWGMTLTNSYLRFSGIVMEKTVLDSNTSITPIRIIGPGIVVSEHGACFYIEKDEWSYISESDTIVIQPKEKNDAKRLMLLISWLKSNIFMWDILWNKHRNSAFFKSIEESFYVPNLDGDKLELLCSLARALLDCEAKFVTEYNHSDLDGDTKDKEEDIVQFNDDVLSLLRRIEKIFEEYYCVSSAETEAISHELKLKGHFSYNA